MQALAEDQGGVASMTQMIALGFSYSTVHNRVRAGRLHRIYQGVYALGRPDLPAKGRRMAAVLACGPGAALSHLSALDLFGVRPTASSDFDVSVPHRRGRSHPRIRIHRRPTLTEADFTSVDGVRCTTLARALLDVAPLIDRRALERAIEKAVILLLYDQREVMDVLERSRGQPGTRRLLAALEAVRPGKTISRSDLEEAMLALCRQHGFPEPEMNAVIQLGGEWEEVDFLWREQRVVVETDGYRYHSTRAAFKRDRRRDRLLEIEGYGHARFADEEFVADRVHIADVLGHLLATRPSPRQPFVK